MLDGEDMELPKLSEMLKICKTRLQPPGCWTVRCCRDAVVDIKSLISASIFTLPPTTSLRAMDLHKGAMEVLRPSVEPLPLQKESLVTEIEVLDMETEDQGDRPNTPKRDFENSDLYKAVYRYVEQYMSRYDCSHDFSHILRVLALAKHILAEELNANPWKKMHKQAVILAALLHDVGDKKYVQSGEEDAIQDLLQKNGCPPRFVAKVALIVEHVSYSSEVKRPQLVKAILGAHPELAIVQDADRLDAIGAIGIGRTFAYGAAKNPDGGMDAVIEHFTDKLENIEGMMKTETGKRLARERTQRLKDFRRWWEEENQLIS